MDMTEVWLAGKGPTLDSYNWDLAGPCRIGINQTAFIIPECWAGFAIDTRPLDQYLQLDAHVFCQRGTKRKYKDPIYYDPVPDMHSTAVIAVQVLARMGTVIIHFVGFDALSGECGYAKSIVDRDACGRTSDHYTSINKHLLKVIRKCDVCPIWEHEYVTITQETKNQEERTREDRRRATSQSQYRESFWRSSY